MGEQSVDEMIGLTTYLVNMHAISACATVTEAIAIDSAVVQVIASRCTGERSGYGIVGCYGTQRAAVHHRRQSTGDGGPSTHKSAYRHTRMYPF